MVGVTFQALLMRSAAAAGPTSITQVLSATSTATTITAPRGIQLGDLIVFLDFSTAGTTPTSVIPTGFTAIGTSLTTGTDRQNVSYKLADGTEGGTSITGMAGTFRDKAMYVFRGNVAATGIVISSPINEQVTTADPTAQVVLSGAGAVPLVVLAAYSSNTSSITARSFTPAKDGEINSSNFNWLAYKIYNSSPADVTVDMADFGTNFMKSFFARMT